ncbi:Ger(x)C family spore germination protein [Niallia taxi]|uniref:Ger(x)C family spore germination protein n=1 Tax=Niallia taxi TaxID=2499688 RepID=UPI0015F7680D|nr:Ger(x)C family spore germination protein [Niallia taxi]
MKGTQLSWLLILCCFFLTGCWDRFELEERANILGLAIDYVEHAEFKEPEVTHRYGEFPDEDIKRIKVTAQIAIPGKIKLGPEGGGGQGSEKTAWVLETYAHTFNDAVANLQQQLAEKIYLGHLQIVVISEDVARDGVNDINEYLRRNHEVRRTAWMVVTGEDAAKTLQVAPPLETVPGLYLSDTLKNAVRFGKLPREYLGKFWIDLADDGIDASIPFVKPIEKDRILIDGMTYFDNDKMVGKTDPLGISAYMSLKEKNPGGQTVTVGVNNTVYMVQSRERKSKIKVDVKDGKPTSAINVEIDAEVTEQVKGNKLSEDTLSKIEKKMAEEATKSFNQFIKQIQDDGSDVIGFGARIRAKYDSYWAKNIKTAEDWTKAYQEMDVKVTVKYNLKRAGMDYK